MPHPNFLIFYVESVKASSTFYADLLGREPVEASTNFAMFALESGTMLGLWSRHDVVPAATAAGGGMELGFTVENDAAVAAVHADWSRRGLKILQEPTTMDFGRTFVALDPDGHRLRVFAPAAEGSPS
jgi:catechol 2,3-dioxygenase-like lactoylglutathione lyase family enzyme